MKRLTRQNSLTYLIIVLLGCWFCLGITTQLPAQADSSGQLAVRDLNQVITTGKQLERQGRWGEALNHYQQALKVIPDDPQIKTRRSIARIHFDLTRRYSDSSYLDSLEQFNASNAFNLYSEVLLKIQSYYVDQPDWDNVLRHGLASMEIAMSDPAFQKKNLANLDPAIIQSSVDEMNAVLDRYKIRSRQDAYVVTSNVCRTLNRRIGLPIQTSVHEFVCGAIISLDPYSAYMTNSQYGETMSQIEGNFVGLGVELKTQSDHLEIVNVISNGPAGLAGITGGDLIISVDGNTVEELGSERAADALRGIEGSVVTIGIRKTDGQENSLRLRRQRVEIPSVEKAKIVDADFGIGYVKLTNFQKTTARDFDAALWKLQQQGMQFLIVDVRSNPGGLLNSSVDIADRFLSSGVIVSTRGRNQLENYVHRARLPGTWRVPLAVLIDDESASASEIFAAAIHDHARGTVVGQQSYGKGSVQGIFPLNIGGGGVRLTTAKFYSPSGTPISQRGVLPNVAVQMAAKPSESDQATAGDDEIFRVGLQVARRHISAQRPATDN